MTEKQDKESHEGDDKSEEETTEDITKDPLVKWYIENYVDEPGGKDDGNRKE